MISNCVSCSKSSGSKPLRSVRYKAVTALGAMQRRQYFEELPQKPRENAAFGDTERFT